MLCSQGCRSGQEADAAAGTLGQPRWHIRTAMSANTKRGQYRESSELLRVQPCRSCAIYSNTSGSRRREQGSSLQRLRLSRSLSQHTRLRYSSCSAILQLRATGGSAVAVTESVQPAACQPSLTPASHSLGVASTPCEAVPASTATSKTKQLIQAEEMTVFVSLQH